jgi:serine/threonine-protein kinase
MSPEQASAGDVSQRSDIFAFGILVWELLAGRRLYKGGNDLETLRLAQRAEVPPLPRKGRPWEEHAQALLDRALDPRPEARFSAADLLHDGIRDIMLATDIVPNQLRFAEFLREQFGDDLIARRREREHALEIIAAPRPGGTGGDGPPNGIERRRPAG